MSKTGRQRIAGRATRIGPRSPGRPGAARPRTCRSAPTRRETLDETPCRRGVHPRSRRPTSRPARDGRRPAGKAGDRCVGIELKREPEIGRGAEDRRVERGIQNTHHDGRLAIEWKAATDHLRVATESPLPESVAEDGDRSTAGPIFVSGEGAAWTRAAPNSRKKAALTCPADTCTGSTASVRFTVRNRTAEKSCSAAALPPDVELGRGDSCTSSRLKMCSPG